MSYHPDFLQIYNLNRKSRIHDIVTKSKILTMSGLDYRPKMPSARTPKNLAEARSTGHSRTYVFALGGNWTPISPLGRACSIR